MNTLTLDMPRRRSAVTLRGLALARSRFAEVAADVPGAAGALLRWRIRRAREVAELWALRAAIVAALPERHPRAAAHREVLRRTIDELVPATGFETLFPAD